MSGGNRLDALHRWLSRSPLAVKLALKLRNQATAVVRYSRAASIHAENNGEAWLVRKLAPSCDTFVDVGANVGNWAELFLAANPRARGLCYEPSPSALEKLRERLGSRVEIIAAAAGAREGTVSFHDPGGADEHASVLALPEVRGAAAITVPMVTLDADLERRGWTRAAFVKIDAEGFDAEVIAGAAGLLDRQAIGVLQFEYNDAWRFAGKTLGHTLAFLEARGYRTHLLTQGALRPVEYERFGDYFGYSNYAAVSPAMAERLR